MEQRLQDLSERVRVLEGAPFPPSASSASSASWSDDDDDEVLVDSSSACARVRLHARQLGVAHRMYAVPARCDYYGLGLRARAALLHAPGVHHLCKLVLVKNCAWDGYMRGTSEQRCNAEFYGVVVQYSHRLDDEALSCAVRLLLPAGRRRPKGSFALRHATQAEADALSGFPHNGISPLGMADASVPLIVDEAVAQLRPPVAYLGGGEVNVKLQVNVPQFVERVQAFVAPVSTPRSSEDLLAIA